jgi:hypothetical protein
MRNSQSPHVLASSRLPRCDGSQGKVHGCSRGKTRLAELVRTRMYAAAVEDSEEEADEHCDVFDTEEWWIRHPSVEVHAVEEQRTPVGTPLSLSNEDTALSQRTPLQRRQERPSAATSSVSWKQWTPAQVASFVRGLTSDFGKQANVYAETLFKEDIDGDVLSNLSPGNLKELGLSLSDSSKLLQRFKEGLSTVRHMQAETEQLTKVPQMPAGAAQGIAAGAPAHLRSEAAGSAHGRSGGAARDGRPAGPFGRVGLAREYGTHSPAQTPALHSLNGPSAAKGAGPMSTAAAGEAAGNGKGQYIHTSPAAVLIPLPEDSQLSATSLAAVAAAHRNGSRNENCNTAPDWSSGLCSPGLLPALQVGQLASTSSATPLHTRGGGSQTSAGQTQRAQLTKEDLKKGHDVNTLPAFDPDATAGLGQHPPFFNALATTRSRILFSLLLRFSQHD